MSNIISLLKQNANTYPDKIAIKDSNAAITYAQLWEQVRSKAAYFNNKNIQEGDRVLIFVPMSVNLYINMLAIFYLGATAVFMDQWSSLKRLDLACQIADCKGIVGVTKARLLWFVSSAFRKIPVYLNPKESTSGEITEPFQSKNDDSALITFTTGSTGRPKAAKRTHGFLLEQFDALINTLHPSEKDVDLITLPIFVLMNLGVGSTSVIADFNPRKPAKMVASKISAQIKNNSCNRIISSPYFLEQLSHFLIQQEIKLPSIQYLFTGGAAVYPKDCKVFLDAFKDVQGVVLYGSTEAEPISEIGFKELSNFQLDIQKNGICVGKTYEKINIRIIPIQENNISELNEQELEALALGRNSIGEIIVSGHHVLTEYYNSNEAFKKNKIIVGEEIWHRTGDAGFIDEANHLFLTGRCNTLIFVKDKVLSPFIFEYVLSTVLDVKCGTVLLIKTKIMLVVEILGNANQAHVRQSIQKMGLMYDEILFVSNIPKDPRHFSKIDYEKLKRNLFIE